MTKPAAISAQLVDMRNVGTHKSLKLTLHVPEEEALKAIAAFGWPTGAHPVPVAIAQLNQSSGDDKSPAPVERENAKPGRGKSFAQEAGILCNEIAFATFLKDRHPSAWREAITASSSDQGRAAECVRLMCGVRSRSEIKPDTSAGATWRLIRADYRMWMIEPSFAPAGPELEPAQ